MGKNDTLISAIYGGSFDPPHLGHREVIIKTLNIVDRVVVVPSWLNPFKDSSHARVQDRLKWCKIVFGDIKGVVVDDFEISQNRAVYTIETYKALKDRYNIQYIVIGADNLKDIAKWRDFDTLNSEIVWIVAKRRGYSIDTSLLRESIIIDTDIDISSSDIRSGKSKEYIDRKIIDEVEKIYNI